MNYYYFLPLIDFYLNSILFFRMYSRRHEHPAITAYLLALLCSMVWGLSAFLLWIPIHPAAIPYLLRFAPYGWFGIGFLTMNFVYAYFGRPRDLQYKILGFITVLSYLLFTILSWSSQPPFYIPQNMFGFYGLWLNFFSLLTLILPGTWTMWLVLQAMRVETYVPRRAVAARLFFGGTVAIILIFIARPIANYFGLSAAPISFIPAILVSLIIMWVINRYGFLGFNLSIVAKDLFDEMQDGILLLNKENQVVNINPAAKLILGGSHLKLPIPLNDILPEVTQNIPDKKLTLIRAEQVHYFDISITPLKDSWNGSGQLIILHDVTAEKLAEKRAMDMEIQKKIGIAMEVQRQRMARDLHDGVSQILYSIKLTAELLPIIWDQNPISARQKITNLRALSESAMVEMRTLLLELRPDRITETPLSELLILLSQVDSIYLHISISTNLDDKISLLPHLVHMVFYRVAQEALNNAIRHSHPTHITLSLKEINQQVILQIEDDGSGFILDDVKGNHFGLRNMQERVEEANMSMDIISTIGVGTTITVSWNRSATAE